MMQCPHTKDDCLCCTEKGPSIPRDWETPENNVLSWLYGVEEETVDSKIESSDNSKVNSEAIDDSEDLTDEETAKLRMDAARRRNKTYGKKVTKHVPNPMFANGGTDLPTTKSPERSTVGKHADPGNVLVTQKKKKELKSQAETQAVESPSVKELSIRKKEKAIDHTVPVELSKTARKAAKKSKSVADSSSQKSSRPKSDTAQPDDEIVSLTKQLNQHSLEEKSQDKQNRRVRETEESPRIRVPDSVLADLAPLREIYTKDCSGAHMMLLSWDSVLQEGSSELKKIAEASFAQVFRVKNAGGTSILKFVELQAGAVSSPEIDSASVSYLVEPAPVESVISEFRVMNALTEIPGFVKFKDAHIVIGKPPAKIKEAYDEFLASKQAADPDGYASYFPDPASYDETAVFLFLELGDAGIALDDVANSPTHPGCESHGLDHIEWVWDILLGVVLALARAESLYKFEHRDLHQNNICVDLENAIHDFSTLAAGGPKFGRSGINITILDYGLSRATLSSGEEIFADLEADLCLFRSVSQTRDRLEDLQYQAYRKMRTHLFFDDFSAAKRPSWHNEASKRKNNGYTWQHETPYSNVLWLGYLYEFLCTALVPGFETPTPAQKEFFDETWEFSKKLVHSPKNKQRFLNAVEVLEYVVAKGWISEEQARESASN